MNEAIGMVYIGAHAKKETLFLPAVNTPCELLYETLKHLK